VVTYPPSFLFFAIKIAGFQVFRISTNLFTNSWITGFSNNLSFLFSNHGGSLAAALRKRPPTISWVGIGRRRVQTADSRGSWVGIGLLRVQTADSRRSWVGIGRRQVQTADSRGSWVRIGRRRVETADSRDLPTLNPPPSLGYGRGAKPTLVLVVVSLERADPQQ